jgi:hypothetical protein
VVHLEFDDGLEGDVDLSLYLGRDRSSLLRLEYSLLQGQSAADNRGTPQSVRSTARLAFSVIS